MLKVGSFLYPVLLLPDGEGISTNGVMLKVDSFLCPVSLLTDDEGISINGVMLKVGSFLCPVLLLPDDEGISTNDVWCWKLAASCTQFYYGLSVMSQDIGGMYQFS